MPALEASLALDEIAPYCAEFLIHAADVEGLCQGVDEDLAAHLGAWAGRPVTYAGGVATMAMDPLASSTQTIGSAGRSTLR